MLTALQSLEEIPAKQSWKRIPQIFNYVLYKNFSARRE